MYIKNTIWLDTAEPDEMRGILIRVALNSYLNFIITAYHENKKDDEQKKHNFTYKTKDSKYKKTNTGREIRL